MTAMSAQRASETPSPENPFLRDLVASLRTVVVPASPATYANRAALREMDLRWDAMRHQWHGTTTAERVRALREQLGLEVRVFGDLEAPPKGPAPPKSAPIAAPTRDPARRPRDGSRTRIEARIAFPSVEEEDELPTPTRRFTVMEVTSGLPDDSREEDEQRGERQLRDLRGRVKAARAVVSNTPGLAEMLAHDWRKSARFYARCGISEVSFRYGARSTLPRSPEDYTV
jgi:hypothetical protein